MDAILERRPDAKPRLEAEIQAAIALLQQTCPNAKLPELNANTRQKDLVQACMQARFDELLAKSDTRTKALIRGLSQKHAGAWKTAAHTPEMFIPGDLFQIMAKFSVGRRFFTESHTQLCPERHKVPLDPFGDHAIICLNKGDVIHRHDDLYKEIVKDARKGMISLNTETTIMKTPSTSFRADVLMPPGIPGFMNRPTAFDLTVSSPLCATYQTRASRTDLKTAEKAGDDKDARQLKQLNALGFDFAPLAFEATGGSGPEVQVLVHYVSQQKALMTGIPFGEVVSRLWQRLSVVLQRSNAFAIKRRYVQLLPEHDEDEFEMP
jgi:hypothetical protein